MIFDFLNPTPVFEHKNFQVGPVFYQFESSKNAGWTGTCYYYIVKIFYIENELVTKDANVNLISFALLINHPVQHTILHFKRVEIVTTVNKIDRYNLEIINRVPV